MGLCKLFNFSGLKFAYFGDESIFMEIHLLIAVDNQAIGVDSEQIFSGEVELHFFEASGLEDGLGGDNVAVFLLLPFGANSHYNYPYPQFYKSHGPYLLKGDNKEECFD